MMTEFREKFSRKFFFQKNLAKIFQSRGAGLTNAVALVNSESLVQRIVGS
jgi:hypothetical protein